MFFSFVRDLATCSKCLILNCTKFTVCQATIIETQTSVLRQNEQHEQIETMANNGPFCKGIENDKGNTFESELWKKVNA